MVASYFDHRERDEQHEAAGQSRDRDRVGPALRGCANQSVDECRHAGGREEGTGDVELSAARCRSLEDPRCGDDDQRADGNVDEQHPPPGREVGEDPAQQQPDGAARARHRGVDPRRPSAGRTLREGVADQRQRRRRRDRAPDALHGAGRDQPGGSRGEAADQRGQREHDEPEHEHAPSTEHVAETASEEQQPSEGEGVRSDDPLEVRGREMQGALDRRQRDRDDGCVQHNHQLRGRDDDERGGELPRLADVGVRGTSAAPSSAEAVGVDRGVRNAGQDGAVLAPRVEFTAVSTLITRRVSGRGIGLTPGRLPGKAATARGNVPGCFPGVRAGPGPHDRCGRSLEGERAPLMDEPIGIIGAGRLGQALARTARRADRPVVIANSRGPESLTSVVDALGAGITAGTTATPHAVRSWRSRFHGPASTTRLPSCRGRARS